jgi:hypothetical protein
VREKETKYMDEPGSSAARSSILGAVTVVNAPVGVYVIQVQGVGLEDARSIVFCRSYKNARMNWLAHQRKTEAHYKLGGRSCEYT